MSFKAEQQISHNSTTPLAPFGLIGEKLSHSWSAEIHEKLGLDFVTCTPGIRQASDSVDDQKRVVTPEKARELGSDYIVVGRSITRAQNPVETYQLIHKQFLGL